MGGTDDPENLVDLTPEEHFIAHQLLVKMYPNETNLIFACHRMTYSENTTNKMFGWLRRKHSQSMRKLAKSRTGSKNGSYGKSWYHNPETLEKIKCNPKEVPDGFVKGRTPNTKCIICGADTGSKTAKYCLKDRKEQNSKHSRSMRHSEKSKSIMSLNRQGAGNPAYGKIWITNGIKNKRIDKCDIIPSGWQRGKLWTKQQ